MQEIELTLLNINDEEPIFKEEPIPPINENTPMGSVVTTVVAIDRDDGDKIE